LFIWGYSRKGDLLPIGKFGETASLICLYHPQPYYPFHIFLVP
jgi:hypothetical protein